MLIDDVSQYSTDGARKTHLDALSVTPADSKRSMTRRKFCRCSCLLDPVTSTSSMYTTMPGKDCNKLPIVR